LSRLSEYDDASVSDIEEEEEEEEVDYDGGDNDEVEVVVIEEEEEVNNLDKDSSGTIARDAAAANPSSSSSSRSSSLFGVDLDEGFESSKTSNGVLEDKYFRQRSPERCTNSSRSSSRSSSTPLRTGAKSDSIDSSSSSSTSFVDTASVRLGRPSVLNGSLSRASRLQTSPERASTMTMNDAGVATPGTTQYPLKDNKTTTDSVSGSGSRKLDKNQIAFEKNLFLKFLYPLSSPFCI
jgi:hypothetical protein